MEKETKIQVLITGSNGQLGNSIKKQKIDKYANFNFYYTDADTLDICNKNLLEQFVKTNDINFIINCAAYTAVDKAEEEPEKCMQINCDAVKNIAEVAKKYNCRVIHTSTDYVFDGQATLPYTEEDATNPQSVYGKTKLAGEQMLRSICANAIIVRTAWLYFETGANFAKTMLRLSENNDTVRVVADQIGTPTYAGDLGKVILDILTEISALPTDSNKYAGIYHYSNEGVCSWCDFANKIFELAQIDCKALPITTAEYPTKAARPAYSVLNKQKIKQAFSISIPNWENSLAVCLQQLEKNKTI